MFTKLRGLDMAIISNLHHNHSLSGFGQNAGQQRSKMLKDVKQFTQANKVGAAQGHGGHGNVTLEDLDFHFQRLGFDRGEIYQDVVDAIKNSPDDESFNKNMEAIGMKIFQSFADRMAAGDWGAAESIAFILNCSLHTGKTEMDHTGLHGHGDLASYMCCHLCQCGIRDPLRGPHGSLGGNGLAYMNNMFTANEAIDFYTKNPGYMPEHAFRGAQGQGYQDNRRKHLSNFVEGAIAGGFISPDTIPPGFDYNIPANGKPRR